MIGAQSGNPRKDRPPEETLKDAADWLSAPVKNSDDVIEDVLRYGGVNTARSFLVTGFWSPPDK